MIKERYLNTYMDMAIAVSKLSYAERKKVGCVIVSPQDLVVYGWNGCPTGWDNTCEMIIPESEEVDIDSRTVWYIPEHIITKPEVLHSEANAIMKAAREGFALKGSSLFVTCSPCLSCAKLIHQAGIVEVYYKELYRDDTGIEFLQKCGIGVKQLNETNT